MRSYGQDNGISTAFFGIPSDVEFTAQDYWEASLASDLGRSVLAEMLGIFTNKKY